MKKSFSIAAIAMSFFAGGCAIHPLPEDVTGVDTYHIVRQIRCETRETVRKKVLIWLADMASHGNPRAQELSLKYESDPEAISTFHYDLFKEPRYAAVRSVAKLFYDTGIAYNFDFTMTEDNDLTAGVDFLKPLTQPRFTLGIDAGIKRKRSNYRTFTVTDTFSSLLKLNNRVYCAGQIVQANYAYPIAGRIGVDKLVNDFIELTLFANLGGKATPGNPGGPPTIADRLTFTTTLNASADPMVVFTPVTSAFQLTNASLTASAVRSDMHQVAVALAIMPSGEGELDPLRAFLFSRDRGATVARQGAGPRALSPLYVGTRVIGGSTPAERLAVIALDQIKSREIQIIPPP